jgi:hypothetical protein
MSPLHEAISKRFPNWETNRLQGPEANKQALLSLFAGTE